MFEAICQLFLSAIGGEMEGSYFPGFELLGMLNMEAKGSVDLDLFWFEACLLPSYAEVSIFEACLYPWAGLFYGKAGLVE